MKVSGFTFIRNAEKFDYPIVEAIQSILPICDEFIVMAGNSDDRTNELIKSINSDKIRIFQSVWDDNLRTGGRVLAEETNKAFSKIAFDSTWAFYIQADEILHEEFLPIVQNAMLKWKDDASVEGLLFNYRHFYGSYDYVGDSTRWYRKEVRIIRNNPSIKSFRDAQGFRINDRPLKVKQVDATMFHYGWVKPPDKQQAKQKQFHRLWHNDEKVNKIVGQDDDFDYSVIDSLSHFTGAHPAVMKDRIARQNWKFSFDPTLKRLSVKSRLKMFIEKYTGWRVGEYKNYRLI